jgi:hypothetical protein
MAKKKGGTVLRGDDGTVYFIRDELLATLAVDDQGVDRLQSVMSEGGDSGKVGPPEARGQATGSQAEVLGYVSGDLLKDQPDDDRIVPVAAAKSTYMCPWFCSSKPQ